MVCWPMQVRNGDVIIQLSSTEAVLMKDIVQSSSSSEPDPGGGGGKPLYAAS